MQKQILIIMCLFERTSESSIKISLNMFCEVRFKGMSNLGTVYVVCDRCWLFL